MSSEPSFYTVQAAGFGAASITQAAAFALINTVHGVQVLITSSLAGGAYVLNGLAVRRDVKRKWE